MMVNATPAEGIALARGRSVLGALRRARLFAIAPHPDDVALSIGGLVRLVDPGLRMTVLTIFGRSAAAPGLPEERRTVDRVTAVRAAEDAAYCSALGVRLIALGWSDCAVRGYPREAWTGSVRRGDPAPPALRRGLAEALADSPDLVLAPLGIGEHVDHLVVRDAVLALAGCTTLLYEDLPYAGETRVAPSIPPSIDSRSLVPAKIEVSGVIDKKIEDLTHYPSQVRAVDVNAVMRHGSRIGAGAGRYAERLWIEEAQLARLETAA
jgi:LmbE family N-acetylglucosaminyl deacetylase